jgi:N-acetylglucosaminyldiphosphoundecaprenol N-acetyl-beta-D-mannosaminyltransferase
MARRRRCSILGTQVDALSWQEALDTVVKWSQRRERRYVCHANVHSIISATRDPALRQVLNQADLVTPDGMPLVWVLRRRGFAWQTRLSGSDFMWRYCARAARLGLKIYLYGGTSDTLQQWWQRLASMFPGIRIVGACAPPSREPTLGERDEIAARINQSGAHAVFVALGCPQQERWMAQQRGSVQAVMFGVGTAFEHHSNDGKRTPRWMRVYGLEWAHRLAQDPRRLWRRYVVNNGLFMLVMMWEFAASPFRLRGRHTNA